MNNGLVKTANGVWALTLPTATALAVAMVTGGIAAAQVAWKLGVDGHISREDKLKIARRFLDKPFGVFNKMTFVTFEPGWPGDD